MRRERRGAGTRGRVETGVPEKTPPTSGIVRHDSHLRKSGVARLRIEPGSPWWETSDLTAQPPRPQRLEEKTEVNFCTRRISRTQSTSLPKGDFRMPRSPGNATSAKDQATTRSFCSVVTRVGNSRFSIMGIVPGLALMFRDPKIAHKASCPDSSQFPVMTQNVRALDTVHFDQPPSARAVKLATRADLIRLYIKTCDLFMSPPSPRDFVRLSLSRHRFAAFCVKAVVLAICYLVVYSGHLPSTCCPLLDFACNIHSRHLR
ncbi:hypothetical protein PR048_004275 [Dryococelus australis]|uniref:Uncharacterized protein n=1 Tax=Dryococelus australis TaxID=614101 RepID=A0ABQ9I534_9NEOP|nr:hypothetical protein PR048_004275 [Dryococelus australis]